MGGIGELSDKLNELLDLRKKERNEYRKKEELIADTYTNLSHDIRTPLTSLDGYFQLIEECDNIDDNWRQMSLICRWYFHIINACIIIITANIPIIILIL